MAMPTRPSRCWTRSALSGSYRNELCFHVRYASYAAAAPRSFGSSCASGTCRSVCERGCNSETVTAASG